MERGIAEVEGFKCGVGCGGIKEGVNKPDVLVVFSERPCNFAVVLTENDIKAAPVKVVSEMVKTVENVNGIVANSGNANACTGSSGIKDAKRMQEMVSSLLGGNFLVASTGVIGEKLPMDRVEKGIKEAVSNLGKAKGYEPAVSIMTTDTFPKTSFRYVDGFSLGGIAKGAGMIDPSMATMLSFIVTDAYVEKGFLKEALREAVKESFNSITVDGDMSTNDCVFLLSNGASGVKIDSSNFDVFLEALKDITKELAYQIVKDGEGSTKVIRISVSGARTVEQAKSVARKVALSPLVKTAVYGNDPNWGRIIASAGAAGVGVEESKFSLFIGDHLLFKGERVDYDEVEVSHYMRESEEVLIFIDLGLGTESFEYLTCDLTCDYVKINAEYRT